jgi:hypothetical protein
VLNKPRFKNSPYSGLETGLNQYCFFLLNLVKDLRKQGFNFGKSSAIQGSAVGQIIGMANWPVL